MKLVHAERLGEAFDSQLVIGVRESYGKENRELNRCDFKRLNMYLEVKTDFSLLFLSVDL